MTDPTEQSPLINSSRREDSDDEEELEGCSGSAPCNPKGCLHRYFPVLILICFLSFGKLKLKKK